MFTDVSHRDVIRFEYRVYCLIIEEYSVGILWASWTDLHGFDDSTDDQDGLE
jgi:hypothetical protein